MGWLKRLLGLEKKEEVVVQEEVKPITPTGVICGFCNEEILQHEKRVKKGGKKLHKKCWKQARRDVLTGKLNKDSGI